MNGKLVGAIAAVLLFLVAYISSAYADAFDPTDPQTIEATRQELLTATGWMASGLISPVVKLVDPKQLDTIIQRRIGGLYNRKTNTVYLSRTCLTATIQAEGCHVLLFHELVHWFQMSHSNWHGTPVEWEFEAQAITARWVLRRATGRDSIPIVWVPPANGKPWRPVLKDLPGLLPTGVRKYLLPSSVEMKRPGEMGHEAYLTDTTGKLIGMWLLRMRTLLGDSQYSLTLLFSGDHPISIDLSEDPGDGQDARPVAWYWDRGFLIDDLGRIPKDATWRGEWVKTR